MFKTTTQLHAFPMLVRLCSKPFNLGFSSTCTKNFQMYKLGLEKAEEPDIKLPQNCTLLITSKVMLKILQARLQQYVNENFQMFKLDLEKAEEPEMKLPTSAGSSKKEGSSRTTSISVLLTMPKPLTVWITANCGKF